VAETDGRVVLPAAIRQRIAAAKAMREGVPATPDPTLVVKVNGEVITPDPAPEPLPAPEPEPAPEPDNELTAEISRLRAAYDTLRGKYNSEIGPLNAQVRQLTEELTRARAEAQKALTPPPAPASLLTEEEIRDAGPELVEVIGKKAREIAESLVSAKMAELQGKLDALGSQVDGLNHSAHTTARERFTRYMDTNLPGWRKQDVDPAFIGWLQQEDAFSGVVRQTILRTAIQDERFDRVKTIFEGYVKETADVAQAGKGGTPRPKLDTLAAPSGGRGRTTAIVPNDAPEAMSGEEVRDFYRKLAQPNHGIPAAEVTAMKARIHAAANAGKIRSQPRV
jgi:hypothetical protein